MSLPGGAYLPLIVFLAETCVVTLCTVRTIFLTRGWKGPAASIGFFEVSIWLFAIGQVMSNLNRIECALAFASGFSLGNFLGVIVEQKLALGTVVVQVTTSHDPTALVASLHGARFGVTAVKAHGARGPVQVVRTVVPRRELSRVLALVRDFDAQAFYAVHDLQTTAAGIFPRRSNRPRLPELLVQRMTVRFLDRLATASAQEPGSTANEPRGA